MIMDSRNFACVATAISEVTTKNFEWQTKTNNNCLSPFMIPDYAEATETKRSCDEGHKVPVVRQR